MSGTNICITSLGNRIRKLHFINSVRDRQGKYSCAIDCFLELWVNVLGRIPCLSRGGNEFLNRLRYLIREYDELLQIDWHSDQTRLKTAREVVWEILREKSPPSFCNSLFC